jgi:hypothetical protein
MSLPRDSSLDLQPPVVSVGSSREEPPNKAMKLDVE